MDNIISSAPDSPYAWFFDPDGRLGKKQLNYQELIDQAVRLIISIDPSWHEHIATANIQVGGMACSSFFNDLLDVIIGKTMAGKPGTGLGGVAIPDLKTLGRQIPIIGPAIGKSRMQGGSIQMCKPVLDDVSRAAENDTKSRGAAEYFKSINQSHFLYNTSFIIGTLSVLIHELAHVKQFNIGTPTMGGLDDSMDDSRIAAGFETQANKWSRMGMLRMMKVIEDHLELIRKQYKSVSEALVSGARPELVEVSKRLQSLNIWFLKLRHRIDRSNQTEQVVTLHSPALKGGHEKKFRKKSIDRKSFDRETNTLIKAHVESLSKNNEDLQSPFGGAERAELCSVLSEGLESLLRYRKDVPKEVLQRRRGKKEAGYSRKDWNPRPGCVERVGKHYEATWKRLNIAAPEDNKPKDIAPRLCSEVLYRAYMYFLREKVDGATDGFAVSDRDIPFASNMTRSDFTKKVGHNHVYAKSVAGVCDVKQRIKEFKELREQEWQREFEEKESVVDPEVTILRLLKKKKEWLKTNKVGRGSSGFPTNPFPGDSVLFRNRKSMDRVRSYKKKKDQECAQQNMVYDVDKDACAPQGRLTESVGSVDPTVSQLIAEEILSLLLEKDPKVGTGKKKKLKSALKTATKKKEVSKKKTIRMRKNEKS